MKVGSKIILGLILIGVGQKAAAAASLADALMPNAAGFVESGAASSRRAPAMARHGLVSNAVVAAMTGIDVPSSERQIYLKANPGQEPQPQASRRLDDLRLPERAVAPARMLGALSTMYGSNGGRHESPRDMQLVQRAVSMMPGSNPSVDAVAKLVALEKHRRETMLDQFFPEVARQRGQAQRLVPSGLARGIDLNIAGNVRNQQVMYPSFVSSSASSDSGNTFSRSV